MIVKDLLFELQTEELPPKSLGPLIKSLVNNIDAELKKSQFDFKTVTSYATPRRLAFLVSDLAEQQPDQSIERRGPALQAAYDSEGQAFESADWIYALLWTGQPRHAGKARNIQRHLAGLPTTQTWRQYTRTDWRHPVKES